LLKHIDT